MSGAQVQVELREVQHSDLDLFFQFQNDPDAIWMAAFTPPDPSDRDAFDRHWRTILADENVVARTIVAGGRVAGHVLKYEHEMGPEVTYWLGREYWGKGIATQALKQFLQVVTTRPVFARAAKDNTASLRVLEKCGFIIYSEGKGHAHARSAEVEEFLLTLSGDH